ncbi:MAG: hypothetical protein P857_1083 [Candidatus Xenolissoclinum pacificiensis L6]|uniref:Uncharacterized protein n=1 Tax=Candidatus Xenolissoclinum pacificiensis L6 TaxID=1401685 RepID=W2V365_9RICK|nr:MAG: hypothetical protein P857_1083 [Candidatus Xenolissoclinum pacificiensis L6]
MILNFILYLLLAISIYIKSLEIMNNMFDLNTRSFARRVLCSLSSKLIFLHLVLIIRIYIL